MRVHVEGKLVFNNLSLRLNAALSGLGLAYLPEDQVLTHIAAGRLVRVLGDWCPPFSGYHLYYPSRRQLTPAFDIVVKALRYRRARSGHRKQESDLWPEAFSKALRTPKSCTAIMVGSDPQPLRRSHSGAVGFGGIAPAPAEKGR